MKTVPPGHNFFQPSQLEDDNSVNKVLIWSFAFGKFSSVTQSVVKLPKGKMSFYLSELLKSHMSFSAVCLFGFERHLQ